MSIQEMEEYLDMCLQGPSSIPERQEMPAVKRVALKKLAEIQASIDYVDSKQGFYDDVLAGRTEYVSNLKATKGSSRRTRTSPNRIAVAPLQHPMRSAEGKEPKGSAVPAVTLPAGAAEEPSTRFPRSG